MQDESSSIMLESMLPKVEQYTGNITIPTTNYIRIVTCSAVAGDFNKVEAFEREWKRLLEQINVYTKVIQETIEGLKIREVEKETEEVLKID